MRHKLPEIVFFINAIGSVKEQIEFRVEMEAGKMENGNDLLGEKKTEKGSRRIDSLGWITESSVMPKKQRAISGVGASSILELRAELYRTQEDIKKIKDGVGDLDAQRSRRALPPVDIFSKKNSGVEERAVRDKLHLKSENDGSASLAALEKKAELYDKLVRGEVDDDDEEKYNVLFYKKGTLEAESEEMERERRGEEFSYDSRYPDGGFESSSTDGLPSKDDNSHSFRGHLSSTPTGLGQGNFIGLSKEQKLLVKEVNEETKQERQKASDLKQKRQELAAKKREELRKAYIKKKLEEMKASATLESSGDTSLEANPSPKVEVAEKTTVQGTS